MQSSKMKAKDESIIELVDNRISDADITNWNGKLNVDGSNATPVGVTNMMKKVETGSDSLNDESSYFGDSNHDHTQIVRRPVLNLWNYAKGKLGTAGSYDRPVYFDGGVPKECDTVLPCSIIDSGSDKGYGFYVGGNPAVGSYTRCCCAFLLTATASPDMVAHTYIGTFTFRHGSVLNYELKCLTGTPEYPMRIAVSYNTNSDSTYILGVYVIPADPTVNTYSNYKLTRIASSAFNWDVKKISKADYDNCNAVAKSASTVIVSSDAVFNSISKSESKTNGCTLKFGTTDGSTKSITVRNAVEADKVDGYHISVGTTVGTDPNTIYIVNAS